MDSNTDMHIYAVTDSEEISRFLAYLEEAKRLYAYSKEEFEHQDKIKVDCLHLLELKCQRPEDSLKVSVVLHDYLLERRRCKDTIAVLEPLMESLESDRGKVLLNNLPQVLGRVRKQEQKIKERIYSPRAMTYSEYEEILSTGRNDEHG